MKDLTIDLSFLLLCFKDEHLVGADPRGFDGRAPGHHKADCSVCGKKWADLPHRCNTALYASKSKEITLTCTCRLLERIPGLDY